ncbi:MAG: phenylalanine 4-monooxygenase [Alphaproteobacteria bacterium]|nr:phenylalanine 4-monooxygenase [Alphaproteobacteria bacterium]MDE2337391.1 phenylalanine 4-monooxygenase [Alphaproteobacteria bacterium]
MDKGIGSAEHYTAGEGWTPGNLDFFTVKQKEFTAEEHDIWRTLYRRQLDILPKRAISLFMDSLSTLGISQEKVPDFNDVNNILMKRTGWQVVAVPGLIPDEPFFELLANRRFPSGNFIRTKKQMDYIQEPDVFHDLFGHVPILADPLFGDYMEAYGKGGLKAAKLGTIDKLARLYWYTVEFGLIQEPQGLRIYGAGILSSPTESVFCLEDKSPHRIGFDLKRILQTHYQIDDFQDNYFVIDSFRQLLDETYADFTPVYKELRGAPVIMPGELREGDAVLQRGTGVYAAAAAQRRAQRARK